MRYSAMLYACLNVHKNMIAVAHVASDPGAKVT
jgi:hypothetical protein